MIADEARVRRAGQLRTPISLADHYLGTSQALVTVVEYGDFECPYTRRAVPAMKMLLARFPGSVRLVWRNFPLEELHPHALDAALAAEAAAGQGKFWQMHDLLFDNQRHLERPQLRAYAERLELDLAGWDANMVDTAYVQRVREDIASGRDAGVRGTPTFFLNGVIHDASFGMQGLFGRVEAELASR